MARSDYDIINLSLEHELNEWLAEKGEQLTGQLMLLEQVAEIHDGGAIRQGAIQG